MHRIVAERNILTEMYRVLLDGTWVMTVPFGDTSYEINALIELLGLTYVTISVIR